MDVIWVVVLVVVASGAAIALVVREIKTTDGGFAIGGLILGLVIGAIGFGYLLQRDIGGIPIGKLHNGDVYQVAFATADSTNPRVAILGLRCVKNGNLGAFNRNDMYLRTYRLAKDTSILPDFLAGRIKTPCYISVYKSGDSVSFQVRKTP